MANKTRNEKTVGQAGDVNKSNEPGSLADSDLESPDDDMVVLVDGELEKRDGETGTQHKKRMAKLLQARAARRKEEKERQKDRPSGRKAGKGNKEGVSSKNKCKPSVERDPGRQGVEDKPRTNAYLRVIRVCSQPHACGRNCSRSNGTQIRRFA